MQRPARCPISHRLCNCNKRKVCPISNKYCNCDAITQPIVKDTLSMINEEPVCTAAAVSMSALLPDKEETPPKPQLDLKPYEQQYADKLAAIKQRFDLILSNEQIRTSHMLRKANTDKKVKIKALKLQLECKNIACLMYVLCTERRKQKLERIDLIEKYTKYIEGLNEILEDSQKLLLHLSSGYKSAARVDAEWKNKVQDLLKEFQSFIFYCMGGTPDANNFYFDLPKLLHCEAPLEINPSEDPCYEEPAPEDTKSLTSCTEEEIMIKEGLDWALDSGNKAPFVVFGDMSELTPTERRSMMKSLKETAPKKSVPPKWKNYVFNDMFLNSDCPNLKAVKDEYNARMAKFGKDMHLENQSYLKINSSVAHGGGGAEFLSSRNNEMRGSMGSLFKIITATASENSKHRANRANLLGVKDSFELASVTCSRSREHVKHVNSKQNEKDRASHLERDGENSNFTLNIGGARKASFYNDDITRKLFPSENSGDFKQKFEGTPIEDEGRISDKTETFTVKLNDSLTVLAKHQHNESDKGTTEMTSEKVCPETTCKNRDVDSFIRSLPAYMRTDLATYIDQTFDNYELCTTEQIEILMKRIEQNNRYDHQSRVLENEREDPLKEWKEFHNTDKNNIIGENVYTKTQGKSMLPTVPLCTCPNLNDEKALNMKVKKQTLLSCTCRLLDDEKVFNKKLLKQTLPPCTCPDTYDDQVFDIEYMKQKCLCFEKQSQETKPDLTSFSPKKKLLDTIKKELFDNDDIEFNRFKVIGEDEAPPRQIKPEEPFTQRYENLLRIFEKHPSLCDLFQGNTRC